MNILATIIDEKHKEVELQSSEVPIEAILERVGSTPTPRGFAKALKLQSQSGLVPAVIAEVKLGSPSKGRFRTDLDIIEIAESLTRGGATCLSVLTDKKFFFAGPYALPQVSSALQKQGTPLPLLRKDFIVESYQVWQSRAMGADAILLIVAALSQQKFEQLLALTAETGMDVLIEVHTEEELHRAVASMKKVFSQNTQTTTEALLGFNNRDLNSFTTDLATSIKLAKVAADLLAADDVPNSIRNTLFIAESGISSAADISSLKQHGLSGFLIGESLTAKGCPQENLTKIIADFKNLTSAN